MDEMKLRFVTSIIVIALIAFYTERYRMKREQVLIHNQETLEASEKSLQQANEKLTEEVTLRTQMQSELIDHKERLEILVRERTAELEQTNQNLVQEIKDRESLSTQRENLEAQLRQSQKMEVIGTLAGGIAHDFNNLLATMLGYSELLFDMLPENSDERSFLDEIYNAGERATELVSQILAFSRIEKPEFKPLLLVPVVEDVIRMLRATIPSTIGIRTRIDLDRQVCTNGNATQIQQVFFNICNNAVYAMNETGGVLDIHLCMNDTAADKFPLPSSETDAFIQLKISDTGSGIPPDIRERIFDPFFTTKEIGEGTGLGLSIALGIIENHNGKIYIDSNEGAGTVCRVFLPIAEKVYSESQTETGKENIDVAGRILVVDDETALTRMYQITLSRSNFIVTMAHNGVEALELFRSHPDDYDLVFTDQIMPKMTGVELCREILKIRPNIPIILATGYDKSLNDAVVESIGIAYFLIKPVNTADLIQLIRRSILNQIQS